MLVTPLPMGPPGSVNDLLQLEFQKTVGQLGAKKDQSTTRCPRLPAC